MSLVEFVRNNAHDLFNALLGYDLKDTRYKIIKYESRIIIIDKRDKCLVAVYRDNSVSKRTKYCAGMRPERMSSYGEVKYITAEEIFPYSSMKSARK